MSPKRLLLVVVCMSLLFSLTACLRSTDKRTAFLFVIESSQNGVDGYLPIGYGWLANSKVEISIHNEPDGPGSSSNEWKQIFIENVDAQGKFGSGPAGSQPFYPINNNQKICGSSANPIDFVAKSLTTETVIATQAPSDLYFTHQPCP